MSKKLTDSQGFDRRNGGIGRAWNPDWRLSDWKKVLNDWNAELPRLGGHWASYLENHDQVC